MAFITKKEKEKAVHNVTKGTAGKKFTVFITLIALVSFLVLMVLSLILSQIKGDGWWTIIRSSSAASIAKIKLSFLGWIMFGLAIFGIIFGIASIVIIFKFQSPKKTLEKVKMLYGSSNQRKNKSFEECIGTAKVK